MYLDLVCYLGGYLIKQSLLSLTFQDTEAYIEVHKSPFCHGVILPTSNLGVELALAGDREWDWTRNC